MKIPYYQVDAFTSKVFTGNPAGVCLLDAWLNEATLQAIAAENNLSETAFVVRSGDAFAIRWFTPTVEVDLCGHATLASAFVLFTQVDPALDAVAFESLSGGLTVRKEAERIVLDFPSRKAVPGPPPDGLAAALGAEPVAVLRGMRDCLAVFETEADVRALRPDMTRLNQVDVFGVIATARGTQADFVSRFFAPREGIPEDPVTGSAHCTLIPYWAQQLGKTELHALQVSQRGGELFCTDAGERVRIAGRAVLYLRGTIRV
ncbi:MAG: PhzF family phenazine biosynthesis protein [Phycisphaerae bacterium]|nr:PhzF family phenazine biosynthesis protein [Phycisphaerae bacterium]